MKILDERGAWMNFWIIIGTRQRTPRYKELLDIKNSSRRGVLTLAILLWRFGSPFGTPTPNMGVHLGVWGFIPSHSLHSRKHVERSWVSHLARNLATPCLGREPKARVATLSPTRRRGQCPHWHLEIFSQCNCFHLDPWPSNANFCGKTLPQANLGVPKFPTLSWQV
jgi:hypothetical protein